MWLFAGVFDDRTIQIGLLLESKRFVRSTNTIVI
jgi:hypothetical protein